MRALILVAAILLTGCVSPAERARALNPDNRPSATVILGSPVLVPGETANGQTLAEIASAEFKDRQRFVLNATGNDDAMALLCSEQDAVDSAIWSGSPEIVLPDLVFLTREPALEETKACQANGRNPVFERIANYKGGLSDPSITGIYAAWDEGLVRDNAIWFLNHIRDNGPTLVGSPAYAAHFEALF